MSHCPACNSNCLQSRDGSTVIKTLLNDWQESHLDSWYVRQAPHARTQAHIQSTTADVSACLLHHGMNVPPSCLHNVMPLANRTSASHCCPRGTWYSAISVVWRVHKPSMSGNQLRIEWGLQCQLYTHTMTIKFHYVAWIMTLWVWKVGSSKPKQIKDFLLNLKVPAASSSKNPLLLYFHLWSNTEQYHYYSYHRCTGKLVNIRCIIMYSCQAQQQMVQ